MLQLVNRVPTASRLLRRPSVVLAVILMAQLMVVLDTTIVNVALPHIQRSLGFTASSLSWVLNGYVLAAGGLLLLGARSGDLLGRRRTFLVGLSVFTLSSLAGGLAVSSWMLLGARALQGVGAAMAAPAALALLTSTFTEGPARIRAIGLYTTISAAGGAIGLVAGGLLTEWASWRWVMFVNVPIGIAVVIVGGASLIETERRSGRFDLLGAVTSTAGMSAVVLGLVEAGSRGWTSPITVAPLALGLVLLGLFWRIEKTAPEPVLPLRVLAHRTRAGANLARGLGYAGMYGMIFFLSQFLQDVQGHSSLATGIGFLPVPVTVFATSQLTTKVLVNHLRPRSLMSSGLALSAGGLLLATQLHANTPYIQVLASLVMIGAGLGVSLVALTSAGLSGIDPRDAGAASGLINVSQQLGAALGLAVLVTVFDSVTGGAASTLGHVTGRAASTAIVHGLDVTFAAGSLFALAAVGLVAIMVRTPSKVRSDDAVDESAEMELAEAA